MPMLEKLFVLGEWGWRRRRWRRRKWGRRKGFVVAAAFVAALFYCSTVS